MNAQLTSDGDFGTDPLDFGVQWVDMPSLPVLPTYNHLRAERQRLNRRLAAVRGSEISTAMARYRRFVTKVSEAEKRGAAIALVVDDGKRFMEPVDLVQLLHDKLDEHRVPSFHELKAFFP